METDERTDQWDVPDRWRVRTERAERFGVYPQTDGITLGGHHHHRAVPRGVARGGVHWSIGPLDDPFILVHWSIHCCIHSVHTFGP